MALKYRRIRGTRDIVPADSVRWQYLERVALEVAGNYGYQEIRTPVIEKTELYTRSVGETTDVVQKEMYSFTMGKENITLRPEGTAGVVRAVLETGMLSEALPAKVSYVTSCFRHDNPQAGRYRQFHQFGIECFGSPSPSADAEMISVVAELFDRFGIAHASLEINSIGCPNCRPAYMEKLVGYYREREGELCHTCKERLEKNPLRLLDCKEEHCHALALAAPKGLEHLCGECEEHFGGLKKRLDILGITFAVNPMIVRGLDYYTKTVFEMIYTHPGSPYEGQALCGGGRYDLLVQQMGGAPTAGLGFGMGLDRILLVMEEEGCAFPELKTCDLYIGSMGEEENIKALALVTQLRKEGFYALCDTVGRSVKAQMKYADKIGAVHSCIIGSNELEQGKASVKEMATGEAREVSLTGDALAAFLYDRFSQSLTDSGQGELADLLDNLMDAQRKP